MKGTKGAKAQKVAPAAKPKDAKCLRCDGTGEICQVCGESAVLCEGTCKIDADDEDTCSYEACPDCEGTGK